MNTLAAHITPPLSAERAQTIARSLDLRALPRDFLDNPYPVYAALRESEPFKRMPDGSYFLTRQCRLGGRCTATPRSSALTNKSSSAPNTTTRLSTSRPWHPRWSAPLFEHHTNSLVFNDPPRHTRVRRLIMGALTRRAIEAMEPGLVLLVDSLLDKIEAQGGGDLIEDFASAIPVEIIGNLLDVPQADREPLRAWSLAILGALEPALTPEQETLGNRSVTEFLAYLRELVAHRRQHPGDPEHDVLTRLIQGEEDGDRGVDALSEVELLHNCVFLLNAGHETTTNLIGNALISLQEWPAQREQLKSELQAAASAEERDQITGLAVDEFLRFESSNQLGNRRALQATQVNGVDLPAGALVTLCIGAANRDPAVYENPEQLDLRRTGNKHLAFGFGVHQCAGLSLARLEGRVAIGRFLQRFPNYQLTQAPVRGGRARFRGFCRHLFRSDPPQETHHEPR